VSLTLITGGTGFVGTHLVQFLKSNSSHIAVLASGGESKPQAGVRYHEVDIREQDAVRSVVQEVKPDRIYHLAGISSVDDSWSNPRLTFEVNVLGAYNLFDAAMSLPFPPRILNISTSQVYASSSSPLTEDSRIQPNNPYAASKAMAELLVVEYRRRTAGGIITTRSFNHTGPGQPPNFVLPSIAKQFVEIELGLRPAILNVGNVEVQRDFTDIRDVIRAYSTLLEKGKPGEVYNVCSGSAVRLADIIRIFESAAGRKVTLATEESRVRSNDVPVICGDPKKIRETTAWQPQISLSKTIVDLLDYWRSQLTARPSA
jgi:GDP-4-dehydro-6-deoxy-D-mannose reductase